MADMQRESKMSVWDGVRDDVQVVVQVGKNIRNQFALLRNTFLKNE